MRSLARTPSRPAAIVACVIATFVLLGWATGIEWLTQVQPRFIATLPNTAVGALATGIAILLMQVPASAGRLRAARATAIGVLALGVLSFVGRLLGRDIAYIGVLFYDKVALHPYEPVGLMATNSAVAFILSGMSLLLMTSDDYARRRLGRTLSAIVLAMATAAILGHVYGASALYAIDRAAGMGLLTAIAFFANQIGILFLRPDEGAASLVTGTDIASSVVRRVLPVTLIVPVLGGILWMEGREANLFTRETGTALFVVATVGWITAMLMYTAKSIRTADRERADLLVREQQARAAAETANKVKGDFLAVMSHELRTPLNAIVGYVSLVLDGLSGPVTPEQAQQLNRIRESARHLTGVVSDVLALTRIEAGREKLAIVPIDLPRLLDEVRSMLEPLARSKRLEFVCECAAPASLESDPHRLKQILINLGGNAIKFTSQGGVRIASRPDAASVLIDVTDTGIGIAPEHLEAVFDEFWQAQGALTRSHGGVGLGLSVSRRLARALGGDISVTSEVGKGSTFTLRLPTSAAGS
jgi:signal transduction histidine kinase